MPYATPKDVLDRHPLKRIAEVTGRTDEKVEKRYLNVAVEDASSEIDSYVGKVYPLPLASPPPVLKRICVDIAVYRLMSLLDKESVEDARRRYEDALKWLQELAAGLIELEGVTDLASGNNQVSFTAPGRVFDADGLKGFL